MARLQRIAPIGIPQHIIQRGNNRQVCFVCDQDMAFYASLLHEYSSKYSVSIHAWVFMTNHVHLLASPYTDEVVHCGRDVSNQALCNRVHIYCNAKGI